MPVGKQATFHIMIISEATQQGLENDYLNVITASLNFEVNVNVYMALPKGVSEATYNTIDNRESFIRVENSTTVVEQDNQCFPLTWIQAIRS